MIALRLFLVRQHLFCFLLPRYLLLSVLLLTYGQARAEGTWQMGLFEGTSHLQYLYETNAGYNIFNVDILSPGEVINVHGCGINITDNIRVTIENSVGTVVYDSTTTGSICDSDLNTTFDPAVTNPHQYVAPASGTYAVSFSNQNGTFLSRYDVTVTNSVNDIIDPRAEGGRVWSLYWYFNANGYTEDRATDANLYVVADGGFVNTFFIWQLDLNNFAGFVYSLRANDLGVTSPNTVGDVVAGISVPESNNSILEKYPIYLGYPAKSFPPPVGGLNVSGLGFVDSDGEDSGISPGSTSTIQDSGTFQFTTDLTTSGVYEIIIDNGSPGGGGPDGVYGQGDIFLRGNAFAGLNTVDWNGEDNNGNIIPEGAYTAKLSVRTGEFHFTAQDVETSGGNGDTGIKIFRAQPSGADLPTTIFWDDETVLNSTAANAFNQEGIFDGDHSWGSFSAGGIGNNSYIDTYAFGLVEEPNPIGVAITENDIPLPTVEKSFIPAQITTDGSSTLRLEINYNGILGLSGVSLVDNMPTGMTLLSNPSSINVSGAGCNSFVFSPATVAGGSVLEIIDGNISANSTCIVEALVTSSLPGDLVNTTSGIFSNELADGVVSNGATLSVVPATGGPVFSCDGSFYELDTVGGETRLYSVNQNTVPFTRQEFSSAAYNPSSGYSYTGLAYNPVDNYLYAIVNESNGGGSPEPGSILRIDETGDVVNMGVPVGGPNTMDMPVVSDRYVGGTIGENGRYVVVTDLSATTSTGTSIPVVERGLILDIDLSSSPPEVIYNRRHGRDVGDIVAHPDGNYYSHNSVEGLITIEPANGFVGIVGGDVSDSVTGLTADAWGRVYAHTDSGNLHSIDVLTGAGTLLSTLTGSALSDAASCGFGVAVNKAVAATEVAPGSAITYTLSIVNAGDSTVTFDLADNLGDARHFVADSLVNPLGGTANAYADSMNLTITGATLAPNSTADISFDVYYPPDYPMGLSSNQASLNVNGSVAINSDNLSSVASPDATTVDVLPNTSVGVAKSAVVNGTDITYEIKLANLGNTIAENITLTESLDAVFGAGNYAFTLTPVIAVDPGTLSIASGYDGTTTNSTLLSAADAGTLDIGAEALIRFAVRVTSVTDMGAGTGEYSNQVELFVDDPDGNQVSDLSVAGDDPDPDGNGIPDEQSPTTSTVLQIIVIEGIVFNDNGVNASVNGGASHDGQQSTDEPAIGGVTVQAMDGTSVIASAVTAGDGSYSLTVPASYGNSQIQITTVSQNGRTNISEYFREDPGNIGVVTDGSVPMTPQLSFTGAYRVDFGMLDKPVWEADLIDENSPGSSLSFLHNYYPRSSGQLFLSVQNSQEIPTNSAWQVALYLDQNCNGAVDSSDSLIIGAMSVDVDSTPRICVIGNVFVPADASGGDTWSFDIVAELTYADLAATGHNLTDTRSLTDLVRVTADGEGLLELSKTVQNLSSGGGVTTTNSGLPGDILRYSIDFINAGNGPITEVRIFDSTPAFTELSAPVVCPAVLPPGIASCLVLVPAAGQNGAGYSGAVQWEFNGALVTGAGGAVDYEIRIE